MKMTIKNVLEQLSREGYIADIAVHFARFICEQSGVENDEALFAAAALASHVTTTNKYICLPMNDYAGKKLNELFSDIPEDHSGCTTKLPELTEWRSAVEKSSCVGEPGENSFLILDEQNRLYLQRYRQYQQTIARKITDLLQSKKNTEALRAISSSLDARFSTKAEGIDWQKVAAAMAIYNRFSVITGGPGTGKTYTIAQIINICREVWHNKRIVLAAPTGKAAARVKESLRKTFSDTPELLEEVNAVTLHSLLKINPRTHTARYSENNPLDADIVIVDETSMIPFALMSKLLSALSPAASLVLVGDKDQLASVEAGAVLNDICAITSTNTFSRETAEMLRGNGIADITDEHVSDHPYAGVVCELIENHRQKDAPEIAALSVEIKAGNAEKAIAILNGENTVAQLKKLPEIKSLHVPLEKYIEQHIAPLYEYDDHEKAYGKLQSSLILCSHRVGPYGSESINKKIESLLQKRNIPNTRDRFYHCRPVMILTNAYDVGLFNGDVGLIWQSGAERGAYFKDDRGGMRCVPVSRLPMHTTAYAVTIHKSQGSEADTIQMYLSDTGGGFITRELVYTGITRAKKTIEIFADTEIFRQGIEHVTERPSGIRDAIDELIG